MDVHNVMTARENAKVEVTHWLFLYI
jgi:hypothetical protein